MMRAVYCCNGLCATSARAALHTPASFGFALDSGMDVGQTRAARDRRYGIRRDGGHRRNGRDAPFSRRLFGLQGGASSSASPYPKREWQLRSHSYVCAAAGS
eukprot:TRINITY_DN6932_c0_g2_i2.p2 TRINITY_DN6932_c0_g2~~TRINITY_DN6932_c0_g2_i2.p2  ORF type:complete len:102 (-),score=4.75 TRINITY_DN6932_c0_g2_i2:955-1260(-)